MSVEILDRPPAFEGICNTGSLPVRIEATTQAFMRHFEIGDAWPGVDIGPRVVGQGCICGGEEVMPASDKSLWGEDSRIGTVQFNPKNKFWTLSLVRYADLGSRARYWTNEIKEGPIFARAGFNIQGRKISDPTEALPDVEVWDIISKLITHTSAPRYVQKAKKPFKFGG